MICQLKTGSKFGDIALTNQIAKRTATILTSSECHFGVLNKKTFNDSLSEASIRYGKGLNYEYTKMAMDRACHLLEIYADAKILKDMVIHDKVDKTPKTVSFKSSELFRKIV